MAVRERPDLSLSPTGGILRPEPRDPRPQAGFGRSVAQGAFKGAGNLEQLVNMGGNALMAATGHPFRNSGQPFTDRAQARTIGPSQPTSGINRVAESATAGIVETLPTLPLGAGAATLPRVAGRAGLEMLSGAAGETAAVAADDAGSGGFGQFGASLAAGMLPGGIVGVGRRAARRLPSQARKSAEREAGIWLRETIGFKQREAAISMLAAEAAGVDGIQLPPIQLLSDIADVERIGKTLTSMPGEAGADVYRKMVELRKANEVAAARIANELLPGGVADEAVAGFVKKAEQIRDEVSKAYAGVGNLTGIPTARIKLAAKNIAEEAGKEKADLLPKRVLSIIDKAYGDSVDLASLRRLRSRIGNDAARAGRKGSREKVRYLAQLTDAIDRTLDEIAIATGTSDVRALQRATSVRRAEGVLFDKRNRAAKAMLEMEDSHKAFDVVLRSNNPTEAIGKLRLIFHDTPEAWGGVQRLMRDKIIGENLENLATSGGAKKARKLLHQNKKAFEAVYGPGSSRSADLFLARVEMMHRGVVGSPGQAAQQGSGNLKDITGPQFREQLSILGNVARNNWLEASFRLLARVNGTTPKSLTDLHTFMGQALVDPAFAKGLLESIPEREFPRWAAKVQRWGARPVRSAVGTPIVDNAFGANGTPGEL